MHHQPTPAVVVLGDSPFDTTNVDLDDMALLGDAPSHTRSPRVVHNDRDSPPPGGAPPITHTTSTTADGQMASTVGQRQPEALTFTANNRTATAAAAAMTSVVIALAATAMSAVVTGSVHWLSMAAVVAFGIVGLGGVCIRPVLRWTMQRQRRPIGTGAIR